MFGETIINAVLADMDNTMVDWTGAINRDLNRLWRGLTISKLDKWPKLFRWLVLRYVYGKNKLFWLETPIMPTITSNLIEWFKLGRELSMPPQFYVCTKLSGIGCQETEMRNKIATVRCIEAIYDFKFDDIIFVPPTDCKTKHFPPGKCLLIDDYGKNIDAARKAGHVGYKVDYRSQTLDLMY